MTTPARRPWPWLAWLALFLAVELPAAIRHTGGTLSETIPRWFPTRGRFALLAQFLVALIAHLYGMVAATLGEPRAWWNSWQLIATSGALMASSIVYAEWERRASVKLTDKAVRWLALRWLRGKVADKEGTLAKVLEALKGWKLIIGVLLVFGVGVYDQMANGHAGDVVGAVLTVLGWMPAADWSTMIKDAVPSMVVIIGLVGKLVTAYKQSRAGATAGELLSTKGYVKAAISDVGVTKTLASVGVPKR